MNERINKCAFETLVYQCQNNAKSKYLKYDKFSQQSYFTYLGLAAARIIFRARTKMLDINVNLKVIFTIYVMSFLSGVR